MTQVLTRAPIAVQIRPHESRCASYDDSMSRVVFIEDDPLSVVAYLYCHYPQLRAEMKNLSIRFFGRDQRNGWQSWLISLSNKPVLWADGPISGLTFLQALDLANQ
jgi:hypothetical protein